MERLTINNQEYDLVTIDFETYYSDTYTLKTKLNTSEYVRHEEFKAHGVGLKRGSQPAEWYPHDEIESALASIDWSKTALLGHNIQFDGFILSQIYKHVPAMYLDTAAMSRACNGHHIKHDLDTIAKLYGLKGKEKRGALSSTKGKRDLDVQELAELGQYCIDDVNDTHALFVAMYSHIPDDELQLIHITSRMFCDPVLRVDEQRVQDELERETGTKVAALLTTGVTADQLLSNDKFATLLRERGVTPPMKVSPTTKQYTYAFSKADTSFTALLTHPDPAVRALVDARLKVKSTIGETRARRFLEAGKDNAPLPVGLYYAGTHTLRWSGGNKMNMQNLRRGGELRRAILAPPGHVIVVADSAQIEARILAWLASQRYLVEAFANGEDAYKLMASKLFSVPVKEVTSDQRFLGKICVLGLGYGMGAAKLRFTLASGVFGPPVQISEKEAQRLVNLYRTVNYEIVKLWRRMGHFLRCIETGGYDRVGPITCGKEFIRLPNGLFLRYPKIQSTYENENGPSQTYLTREGRSRIYSGLLTENVVQALARCVIAEHMLKIDEKYRVVTMTHDEIIAVAPEEQGEECLNFMLQVMKTPPQWAEGLPLHAEGGWDVNYSK